MKASYCKRNDGERSRDAYDPDQVGSASHPRFVHDRSAFVDVAWLLRTLPGNVAQMSVPTTNRITSLARFENLLACRLKCNTHFHACAHILVLAILTSTAL